MVTAGYSENGANVGGKLGKALSWVDLKATCGV
jgi:hypothetical protein